MSGYDQLLQEITGATGGSTGGQYSFGAWDVLGKGVDLSASSASKAYDNLIKHYGTDVAYQLAEEVSGGAQFRNDGDIRLYLQGALDWGGTANGGLLSSVRANGNVFTPSSSLVVAPPKPTPPNANQPSPPITINAGGELGTPTTTGSLEASAYEDIINNYLDQWGLDTPQMQQAVQGLILQAGDHYDQGAVIQWIRNSPEYAAAFPGMAIRAANGLPPISEAAYKLQEDAMLGYANDYNIPKAFMSNAEIGTLIGNGVSPDGVKTRLENGYAMVMGAPPETRRLLHDYFGVNTGDLAAYYLNPAKAQSVLLRNTQAAMIGTAAYDVGFHDIGKNIATQLAQQELASPNSMDLNTFRSGFAKIAGDIPLETKQVGMQGEATVNQRQLISSVFPGMHQPTGTSAAGDATALRLAAEARIAGMSGGGGFKENAKGAVGIGRAGTQGVQGT